MLDFEKLNTVGVERKMPVREKIGADVRDGQKRQSPQHIEIKRERVGLAQTKMSNREELDILIGGDGGN